MDVSLKRSDWETASVGFLGDLLKGVSYKKDDAKKTVTTGNVPILRANNIVSGTLYFEDLVFVPQRYISDVQFIKRHDIIFCMSSGSKHLVGKSAKAVSDFRGSCGAFCALFRPLELVNPNYLAYFFQGPYYKRVISEISKGTNINNLKREHIVDLIVPLPPLPEQRRIVAKIEELFSELDKAVETLKTLQQQLKAYRQAILKSAFEGKLTEEWRKTDLDNSSIMKDDCYDNFNGIPGQIPVGWEWVQVDNTSSHIVDCLHSTPEFTHEGYYCIDTTCIRDSSILFDKVRYVSENTFKERNVRLIPAAGDILFAREGTVGTSLIVPPNTPICLGQRMMLFRPKIHFNCKFLMYYFQSPIFKAQYQPRVGGTTSPHLNIRDIKRLLVPSCKIAEQGIIVEEIESRLSVSDKIEETIEQNLQQAEALRQSILKKAFEGRLLSETELAEVRQEPDWEPASVLLEKIRSQKEVVDTVQPPAKKTARKGKKQA